MKMPFEWLARLWARGRSAGQKLFRRRWGQDALLAHITDVCRRASQGDLEARILEVADGTRLGEMSLAINQMLDVADCFVREAAAAMEKASHREFHRPILLRGLAGAYRESAQTINRAGLKMREDSEQLDLVGRVASACEQLNSASAQIAERAEDSAGLTGRAVSVAGQATESVGQLDQMARNIEGIVEVIRSITMQTDLLALNAAIEAARAGDRGASFGVVANEVKDLARNTAGATADIRQQIVGVQSTVVQVARDIQSVGDMIRRVHQSAASISQAVGEQVQATADLARSIHQVSGYQKGPTDSRSF